MCEEDTKSLSTMMDLVDEQVLCLGCGYQRYGFALVKK